MTTADPNKTVAVMALQLLGVTKYGLGIEPPPAASNPRHSVVWFEREDSCVCYLYVQWSSWQLYCRGHQYNVGLLAYPTCLIARLIQDALDRYDREYQEWNPYR